MPIPQPDYQPFQTSLAQVAENPRASPDSFSANPSALGPGLDELARGAAQAGYDINREKRMKDSIWAETTATAAQADVNQWHLDHADLAGKDMPGAYEKWSADYREKMLASAPPDMWPQVQKYFQTRMDFALKDGLNKSFATEANALGQQRGQMFDQQINNLGKVVSNNPEQLQQAQDTMTQNLDAAEKLRQLAPGYLENLRSRTAELSLVASDAYIATNPSKAEEIIRNADGLTPEQRMTALKRVDDARSTLSGVNQLNQEDLLKSNVESIQNTGTPANGFDPKDYASAFPAKDQQAAMARATSQITVAQNVYKQVTLPMQAASPGEIDAIVAKAQPTPGASDYGLQEKIATEAQAQATKQRNLLEKDPFTYSLQNSVVKSIYDRASSVTDPQKQLQSFQDTISASVGWQQTKLGVSRDGVTVAPAAELERLAGQLNTAPAAQVKSTLQQVQQTFGPYYADAMRNLASLPTGKRIDGGMAIVAANTDKGWADDLISALRTNPKSYNFSTVDDKAFTDQVSGNTTLTKFQSAMISANPAMSGIASSYTDAVKAYAKQSYAAGKFPTPDDAVSDAVTKMVGSQFTFAEINGHQLPIPLKAGSGGGFTPEDAPNIAAGLGSYLKKMDTSGVDARFLGLPDQMAPKDRNDIISRVLQNQAFWTLSPDNNAAVLMMQSDAGRVGPVMRDGSPVRVMLNYAGAMGAQIPPDSSGLETPP